MNDEKPQVVDVEAFDIVRALFAQAEGLHHIGRALDDLAGAVSEIGLFGIVVKDDVRPPRRD